MSETQASAPASLLGGEGVTAAGMGHNGGPDWLPEELRAEPSVAKFKDVASLAKSYAALEKRMGVPPDQLIKLPGKEDAPEWGEVFDKLGRPKAPTEYELTAPAGVDEKAVAAFREAAHKAGLTKRQAAAVMEFYGGTVTQGVEALNAQMVEQAREAERTLQAEWGKAYADKLHGATRLVQKFGGDETLAALNEAGLGRNPLAIKFLAAVADALGEGGALKGGSGGQASGPMTPEQAKAEIGRLTLDGEFQKAYWTKDHPGHDEAVRRKEALYAAAYPGVDG